jgi:hypothetical protein
MAMKNNIVTDVLADAGERTLVILFRQLRAMFLEASIVL